MPLTLEPLQDSEDKWVLALERLSAKIKDPNLSFHKYLVAKGFPAPNVFDHTATGVGDQVFDPPRDLCPAVVLYTTPTLPGEDRGAGNERWYFDVGILFKIFVPEKDQRIAIRAMHELIRTVFAGWRTGTLDPLSTIPGVGYQNLTQDVAPVFMQPSVGSSIGRATMTLRFSFAEAIYG